MNIEAFVRSHVTGRRESMFAADIETNGAVLEQEISGSRVMVIGGAGTIGSNYIKELLRFHPALVVIIDVNENGLTELVRDCRSRADLTVPDQFITYPVSYSDPLFVKIFDTWGPFDIVANFAAHKHVRSEKDVFSIEAMVNNNVLHNHSLIRLLLRHPPKHFFCVSTDKAANPVNITGATKKLMENLLMAYTDELKITTARFANVAFSNGSLPAGFLERLAKHQPLSCPVDVKRFFVSPEESGQICLLASILGQSGEIFYPQLEEEHLTPFSSFVAPLLSEFGFEVEVCEDEQTAKQLATELTEQAVKYPVYFFKSDTDGEKMYEEFYTDEEQTDERRFASLGVILHSSGISKHLIEQQLVQLKTLLGQPQLNKESVVTLFQEIVPGFEHAATGRNLDQKM